MFVCDACLKKNYTNDPSFFRSFGRCEDCGKSAGCSDIPSRALHSKPQPALKRPPMKRIRVTIDVTLSADYTIGQTVEVLEAALAPFKPEVGDQRLLPNPRPLTRTKKKGSKK